MESKKRPTGMFGFTLVWVGQLVSVLSTNMTAFALTIWVFEETGSVTALGLMQVFFITPYLLITPFAGVMVDRYDRKLMMMVSDMVAGLATIAILILQSQGMLQVWQLYVAAIFQGLGNAFQWPAYSATISLMVPKEQYGRANGMMSLIDSGPGVLAPLMAGALLPLIGLVGILSLDVTTFILAVGILFFVSIPQPARTWDGAQPHDNIFREASFGFKYIFARPSLLGLQLVFFFGNLCLGIVFTLLAPMILLRTGNNTVSLGLVQSAGAIGGVVGGIAMSLWGGFKRRVHGVLAGWMISSFFASLIGLSVWLPVWIGAMALSSLFGPLINGSNQAIWQSKVLPDMQGRVFSARTLIAWLPNPIAPLIAGILADYVLEPAMSTPGGLPLSLGGLIPPGPGAGMGLLIFLGSLGGILAGLTGYFVAPIRNAEDILPDHDALPDRELA
jgi:MFS transporter, DHA3 family, macrolide efflux protein